MFMNFKHEVHCFKKQKLSLKLVYTDAVILLGICNVVLFVRYVCTYAYVWGMYYTDIYFSGVNSQNISI